MENIIQQIALDLVEKITKKAFEAKISDIEMCIRDSRSCAASSRSISCSR